MCYTCGNACCRSNRLEKCGCDRCTNPLCWTDEQWLQWNEAGEPEPALFVAKQIEIFNQQRDLFDDSAQSASDADVAGTTDALA